MDRYGDGDATFDLYVCGQSGWPTVVLRWGPDPPEYDSGAYLAGMLPEPQRTAARAGLAKEAS